MVNDAPTKIVEYIVADRAVCVLCDAFAHIGGIALGRFVAPAHRNHVEVLGQAPAPFQLVQRRHQLFMGQVSGRAEYHHDDFLVGRIVHVSSLSQFLIHYTVNIPFTM